MKSLAWQEAEKFPLAAATVPDPHMSPADKREASSKSSEYNTVGADVTVT